MLGGDEHDVVDSLPGDTDPGDVEGRGYCLSIDVVGVQLSERSGVDVSGSKYRLVQVLTGASVVVVMSQRTAVVGDVDHRTRCLRLIRHRDRVGSGGSWRGVQASG